MVGGDKGFRNLLAAVFCVINNENYLNSHSMREIELKPRKFGWGSIKRKFEECCHHRKRTLSFYGHYITADDGWRLPFFLTINRQSIPFIMADKWFVCLATRGRARKEGRINDWLKNGWISGKFGVAEVGEADINGMESPGLRNFDWGGWLVVSPPPIQTWTINRGWEECLKMDCVT